MAVLEAAIAGFTTQNTVIAPHDCFSGCGHQVTNHQAIKVQWLDTNRYKVFGAPAGCTRIGLIELARDADWVLSGINSGGNLGVDLVMSATVAAIREAAWLGKPGIALYQYSRPDRPTNGEKAARMAASAIADLIRRGLADLEFWNVNLPDVDPPAEQIDIVDSFVEPSHVEVRFQTVESGYFFLWKFRAVRIPLEARLPRIRGGEG